MKRTLQSFSLLFTITFITVNAHADVKLPSLVSKWMVRLKPLKAGGPFTLTVSGKNKIELKDVMVGEVWICGGQSNMQWRLNQTDNADAEIAVAKYPMMRLFTTPRSEVDAPTADVKAGWKECSPKTAATFSAVVYYFGRDLRKARNVPIGLINNA